MNDACCAVGLHGRGMLLCLSHHQRKEARKGREGRRGGQHLFFSVTVFETITPSSSQSRSIGMHYFEEESFN
jgi:hypothetical protein